jgi:hypothetical protein
VPAASKSILRRIEVEAIVILDMRIPDPRRFGVEEPQRAATNRNPPPRTLSVQLFALLFAPSPLGTRNRP